MYPFGFESHYISQKAPSVILLCLSLYLPSKPSQLLYPFSSLHAVTNTHIRHDNSPSLYCKMQPHSTASRFYLVSLILLHNLHSIAWQTPNIFTPVREINVYQSLKVNLKCCIQLRYSSLGFSIEFSPLLHYPIKHKQCTIKFYFPSNIVSIR